MVREAERTGAPVYLTMAHLDPGFVRSRFPMIAQACAEAGLDLTRDPVPVSPAAHYIMGGVETDLDGRTSLPGLFAAGEVACTGVHGANRLASNSLLEGLVFGARAAIAMQSPAAKGRAASGTFTQPTSALPEAAWASTARDASSSVPAEHEVRDLMWRHAGLVRDRAGLEQAVSHLAGWSSAVAAARRDRIGDPAFRRVSSIVTVGFLIARAALRREESRGGHFRADFPAHDDLHWKRHVSDLLHV